MLSRGILVGVYFRLRAGQLRDRCSVPYKGKRCASLQIVQAAFYLFGTGDTFPGVERTVLDTDQSPQSRVKIKNNCKSISTLHMISCRAQRIQLTYSVAIYQGRLLS